jgi:uncharacterized protein (TIGR03083 family)
MTRAGAAEATPTRPRTSTLDRPTLMRLAGTEYERGADLLRSIGSDRWTSPTECPGWDVRALASHVLGMAEMAASIREGARQQKLANRRGGLFIDTLTALQVEERLDMTPAEVTARFQVVGPKAARARRRTPWFIRRRRMPIDQPVGDIVEPWTLGYLIDTILTRDPWMHRIDLSRAAGVDLEVTAAHDGVLVADVVTEWAARHGKSVDLTLTGAAGGSWQFGTDGPSLELDAIEFCRTLSGRTLATGLLTTEVPF